MRGKQSRDAEGIASGLKQVLRHPLTWLTAPLPFLLGLDLGADGNFNGTMSAFRAILSWTGVGL